MGLAILGRVIALVAGAGLVAAGAGCRGQATRADAEKDPVLRAMLAELDRSKNELQLKGFEKPFFIEYRIEDVQAFETRAEFGATEGASRAHQRVANVLVRVGDYKTDSSTPHGDGALQVAALSDDPVALRCALWEATDQAYKTALDAYAQKLAERKQVQTAPQANDFSKESALVSLEQPLPLEVDEKAWVERVAKDSGLYRTDARVKASEGEVQYATAAFTGRVTTTWLANSEGTVVRKSGTNFEESFGAGTQAADGMHLDRSYVSSGAALSDLDAPEVFAQHAVGLIGSLSDLRKAPVVEEEYHGPVLLSADASADVLRSLLERGIMATRPRMGSEARTNGPFASSYHAKVMPEFMDAVDDPSLKSFEGHRLIGAFRVDDQGVPAQAVKVVTAGKLENYLVGREPVRDFPQSNGHARAGLTGPARPTIGVLKISAENGLGEDELQQKLLGMAKDRDLKSVYFVETMGGPKNPRLLYRMGVDGQKELVRGAELADLDQRALRSSVEAAGKRLWVANYPGEIPETVLAPALLLSDATVKRADEKHEKLPFYAPPEP